MSDDAKFHRTQFSRGAMYVFLILSRDRFKNTHLAPLRWVHGDFRGVD